MEINSGSFFPLERYNEDRYLREKHLFFLAHIQNLRSFLLLFHSFPTSCLKEFLNFVVNLVFCSLDDSALIFLWIDCYTALI
jgi:hypothetical protein